VILLDTDHVSLLQRGGPSAHRIDQHLQRGNWNRPPTTIITYEEQMRGWIAYVAAATTMDGQIEAYSRLSQHVRFYATLEVVSFTTAAAVHYQRLRSLKLKINTMDLKISAIALANNATLWTRNRQHFSRVPGLQIFDAAME
jgi:tRNA(fMet)-specific endonuclease VapC